MPKQANPTALIREFGAEKNWYRMLESVKGDQYYLMADFTKARLLILPVQQILTFPYNHSPVNKLPSHTSFSFTVRACYFDFFNRLEGARFGSTTFRPRPSFASCAAATLTLISERREHQGCSGHPKGITTLTCKGVKYSRMHFLYA